MRAVLVGMGSQGDVAPFLALAQRLVTQGHEAVVVSHGSLLPAQIAGVELVAVDNDPSALLRGPAARALRRGDLRGLNRSRGLFADFLDSVAAPLTATLGGADVVVASTFAMAAVAAAREHGVPVVRAQLWPEGTGLKGPMPLLPYSWLLPAPARRGARWALRQAEPLLAGFDGWWSGGRLHILAHHDAGFTTNDLGSLHAYSPALVGPSDEVSPRHCVTGWWADRRPAEMSSATSELLARPGPPWAYVGFGSMPQRSPEAVLGLVERACRRTGLRAVVQMPMAAPLSSSGSPVHVIGPEPHSVLFSHMAVAVHHGGSGTTGAVVGAGIPSVVVPHVADQFYWAHRLHAAGVAPSGLPRPLLSAPALARLLGAALHPDMAGRARALGDRVRREDGTGAAVRHLELQVEHHG